MTITLAPCSERPAPADIDPLLAGFFEELSPKLVSIGSSAGDIPFWIEDFWHHADQYLPRHGRIWIARDDTGQAVGVRGTLRQIRPDAGEMKRLYVRPEARGQAAARRLVQARIDDGRTMGWLHLFADTFRDNIEMQTLYQSIGSSLHRPASRKRRSHYIECLCVDPEIHATRPLTPQ